MKPVVKTQHQWFLASHSIVVATAKPNTGRPSTWQRCHPEYNYPATLQSSYDVDLLVLPPLLPDSGIGTYASGFALPELASRCLSVCLLAFVYSVPVSGRLSRQDRACYEQNQPALHPLLNFYTQLACSWVSIWTGTTSSSLLFSPHLAHCSMAIREIHRTYTMELHVAAELPTALHRCYCRT